MFEIFGCMTNFFHRLVWADTYIDLLLLYSDLGDYDYSFWIFWEEDMVIVKCIKVSTKGQVKFNTFSLLCRITVVVKIDEGKSLRDVLGCGCGRFLVVLGGCGWCGWFLVVPGYCVLKHFLLLV